MIRRPLVGALAMTCALVGVGCGSSSGPSSSAPTSTPSVADPRTNQLSQADLSRAQTRARALADCLRQSGIKVATDPEQTKSTVMKLGDGVLLRADWSDVNGADVYMGGTRHNTNKVAAALQRQPFRFKGRILVLFDRTPSSQQGAEVEHCVGAKTV